jgi:predicted nucleic acid-binding protein
LGLVVARIILDSSAVIAAAKRAETAHDDALAFLERLRAASAEGIAETFAPPELWLEVHVAEQRLARGREGAPASALAGLAVTLVAPPDLASISDFLDRLTARTQGRRPFVNATDLVYLWAADHVGAVALVTLDHGLLKYDRIFCEVRRPEDVWFG